MTINLDTLAKDFGKKIKIERIKQEISQEKLAELADLHRVTLGAIEKGSNYPSLLTIAKLANALNLTLPQIVDFNF